MYRSTLLLAALLIACSGPTGPQGATGSTGSSGPPYQRTASYCAGTSISVNAANGWSATANCIAAGDIPLQGFCYEPAGLPTGAYLQYETAVDWSDLTKPAAWKCTWWWPTGAPQDPSVSIPVTVEICCATPQQS